MKTVVVTDISPIKSLDHDLHDAATGAILFRRGERLSDRALGILKEYGVKRLIILDAGETQQTVARSLRFMEIDVRQIAPGTELGFDICTPDGNMLLSKGTVLSQAVVDRVVERGIRKLYVRRPLEKGYAKRVAEAISRLEQIKSVAKAPKVVFDDADLFPAGVALSSRQVSQMLDNMGESNLIVEADQTQALSNVMHMVDAMQKRDEVTKGEFANLYQDLIRQTQYIFYHMRQSEKINSDMLMKMTEQVVQALVSDRELLLCSLYIDSGGGDYLARHAVNVTVIATNIAAAYGYSPKQVTEIGYCSLLADIGMLKVPDAIRFKEGALSSNEQLEVMRHTLHGIDQLQLVNNIPKVVPLVAFQSHERLDGSGYPHGKSTHAIHDYAKLFAVADVYHAIISKRPYRPEGQLPYKAIEELLMMSSKRKLDSRFCRCLLKAISLFPVGSWVQLSSGETARVLAANMELFTKPAVVILYDANGNPCEPRRVNLLDEADLNVVRAAHIGQHDPMVGF